jgi:hypothetical protein
MAVQKVFIRLYRTTNIIENYDIIVGLVVAKPTLQSQQVQYRSDVMVEDQKLKIERSA